jgi:hypothetical protein
MYAREQTCQEHLSTTEHLSPGRENVCQHRDTEPHTRGSAPRSGYDLDLGGHAEVTSGEMPPRLPQIWWCSWLASPTGDDDLWMVSVTAPVLRVA